MKQLKIVCRANNILTYLNKPLDNELLYRYKIITKNDNYEAIDDFSYNPAGSRFS